MASTNKSKRSRTGEARRSKSGSFSSSTSSSSLLVGSTKDFLYGSSSNSTSPRTTINTTTTTSTTTTTGGQNAVLHAVSSMTSLASAEEMFSGRQSVAFLLFAYRMIYLLQGMFLGLLGPSLGYFSILAMKKSALNSPVASFGPIFAAHGGAALLTSFMSEIVLNWTIEIHAMKYLMIFLLICSSIWYGCLTSIAGASGSLGVGFYFIAKGIWTSLLNICINRCCLWVADEKIEKGRRIVTSMNISFGLGTILGPALAAVLNEFSLELSIAFTTLGCLTVVPFCVILCLSSPQPKRAGDQDIEDENQTLLSDEDHPTRRVPTVPSPIVGGVFLHVKHYAGGANLNPDTYDPMSNLIVLFVTMFATILFGIQLGLGAFLFDYVGHVLTVAPHPLPNEDIFVWGCMMMMVFWTSLWLSYCFFSKYMFHSLHLFSIFHLSIICMISSFGILFGAETGFACFTICLIVFGFALAPLFTLSIHCLTRVINEALIKRVSSLIVFGGGMGEVFIPVLMGFFMGDYSGQMYGSVAVSYITFILSICLVGVSGVLLIMVKKKLKAVERLLATTGSTDHHYGRGTNVLLPVHEQSGSSSIGSSSSSRRNSFGGGGGNGNNGPNGGTQIGIRRNNGGF